MRRDRQEKSQSAGRTSEKLKAQRHSGLSQLTLKASFEGRKKGPSEGSTHDPTVCFEQKFSLVFFTVSLLSFRDRLPLLPLKTSEGFSFLAPSEEETSSSLLPISPLDTHLFKCAMRYFRVSLCDAGSRARASRMASSFLSGSESSEGGEESQKKKNTLTNALHDPGGQTHPAASCRGNRSTSVPERKVEAAADRTV